MILTAGLLAGSVPAVARIPVDVSMGFTFGAAAVPAVAGEVTEQVLTLGACAWVA